MLFLISQLLGHLSSYSHFLPSEGPIWQDLVTRIGEECNLLLGSSGTRSDTLACQNFLGNQTHTTLRWRDYLLLGIQTVGCVWIGDRRIFLVLPYVLDEPFLEWVRAN